MSRLLLVNPAARLTPAQVLVHSFITERVALSATPNSAIASELLKHAGSLQRLRKSALKVTSTASFAAADVVASAPDAH